jgi:hypothetical protein
MESPSGYVMMRARRLMTAEITRDLGNFAEIASRQFASERVADRRVASTRFELSRWFLIAAVAAMIPGNVTTSFAHAAGDDHTIAAAIDQAVRSGDFSHAAAALRRLAEQGNAEAQYRLSALYRLGRGVPQDDASAFKWMKAAEQNHAAAQFNLARMYLAGHGVTADAAAAKAWMQKAAAQRHDEAARALATNTPAARELWDVPRRLAEARANAQPATASGAAQGPAKVGTLPPGLATASRNAVPVLADAAWRGQTDAVKLLISAGADIAARDEDGNTALALAASAGRLDAVNALLSARAEVDAENRAGERPLMLSVVLPCQREEPRVVGACRRTGRLRVLFDSTVSRIGRDDVVIEQNGRRLRIRNDTVIVCAGGILPTAFLKSVGIEVETKYGKA